MILYPPAKINLGLYVINKHEDGYHSIETLFYPLPGLCDILEFEPFREQEGESDCLSLSGIPIPGDLNDNLLLKTCNLFREKHPLPPMKIHLHKRIPMGAGLGGGSADAAYLLRGLNSFSGNALTKVQLSKIAKKLGSDCPYFLCETPAIGEGRGEILREVEISLSDYHFYLFSPEIHISTKEAYKDVKLFSGPTNIEKIIKGKATDWRGSLINSFENSIFRQYPAIAKLKESIYESGALYASMSGSGSAVFGLFQGKPDLSDYLIRKLIWFEKLHKKNAHWN